MVWDNTFGKSSGGYDFGVAAKAPCNGKGFMLQNEFHAAKTIPCKVHVNLRIHW